MKVGAVLVLGRCIGDDISQSSALNYCQQAMPTFFGVPATLVDLLGEPILYRIVENLRKSRVDPILLVTDDAFAEHAVLRKISQWRVHVRNAPTEELRMATQTALQTCQECGTQAAIVMQASQYVELDVAELLQFHCASGQLATSVRDRSGRLGTTIVGKHSTKHAKRVDRQATGSTAEDYMHHGYANRLNTPHDLRRLAQDALLQLCTIQPSGTEVQPGVWVSPSARLHSRARVIAPAYIGAHTRLRSGVVIACGTNIEHHCEVDHGTVVENTTIMPHTYLGSSLDIAHSIVSRNTIVHVRRAVEVEIGDHSLIGPTSPLPRSTAVPLAVRSLPIVGPSRWKKLSDALGALLSDRPASSPALVQYSCGASERQTGLAEVPGSVHSRTVGG